MPSSLLNNRNVVIKGRRTSMKLEPEMWEALEEICSRENLTVNQVCTLIADCHDGNNLTAAIRVFILSYFRAAATDEGHSQVGHGREASSAGASGFSASRDRFGLLGLRPRRTATRTDRATPAKPVALRHCPGSDAASA